MIPIFNILRGLWKQKPQAWGNVSDVQSGLFHNAEQIGIDPYYIKDAIPFWELARTGTFELQNYGRRENPSIINNQGWVGNGLDFSTATSNYGNIGTWDGGSKVTIIAQVSRKNTLADNQSIYTADQSDDFLRTLQLRFVNNNIRFVAFVSDDAIPITGASSIPEYEIVTVCGVNDGVYGYVYYNGVLDVSPVSTGPLDTDAAKIGIACRWDSSSTRVDYLGAIIYCLFRYDGALDPSIIAFLSDNPWQLWQPRAATFYSFEAGAAPSGWSHKIMGVEPGAVSGVDVGDIDKIDGV